jgi:hypothetical protein
MKQKKEMERKFMLLRDRETNCQRDKAVILQFGELPPLEFVTNFHTITDGNVEQLIVNHQQTY